MTRINSAVGDAANGNQTTALGSVLKRWIGVRVFAWFDNGRRLCRNDEFNAV